MRDAILGWRTVSDYIRGILPGGTYHTWHDTMQSVGDDWRERMDHRRQREQATAGGLDTAAPTTGHNPPSHTTHNDFRNSRFDITQNFGEGYDPDRIAVAFTRDLNRVSDRRLSSQLVPAWSTPG